MKKFAFLLLTIVVMVSNSLFAQNRPKRVIILGFDGISVDGFKTAKHPNIDRMFADGVLSLTTRSVMPSVTLPNWTSHLAGSGPEEHGVTSNEWKVDKHSLQALETDNDGYFPSIFKVLKDHVPGARTAFYYNWPELVNSMNKKYIDELSFQRNDRYDSIYQQAFDFIVKNRANPVLVFLYTVHTDHAGHNYRWMSDPYIKSIEQADTAVGVFLDRLRAENLYNRTHFLFITDHGGSPQTGHGGVSMQEMQVPWAIAGPQIKKLGLTTMNNSNKNTSVVIAKLFGVQKKKLPQSWTGYLPGSIFR